MMKAAIACFGVGSCAGVFAFTGEPGPDWADAAFVASYVAGLALVARSWRRDGLQDEHPASAGGRGQTESGSLGRPARPPGTTSLSGSMKSCG